MRRIRVELSYDGTDYHGWQVQPGLATIQGSLETVLAAIEGETVQVAGSGRTDAGVHALAQVAAFSLENPIPVDNLRRAMNRLLPRDIRLTRVEEVAADFIRASRRPRRPTNTASSAAKSVLHSSGGTYFTTRIRSTSKG